MSELIKSEHRGSVVVLTLNRPKALNALDRATLEALGEALEAVASDKGARALVLTGEGRAFAAGADIEQMSGMNVVAGEAFSRLGHAVFERLEALSIPTIAAVNGYALGGGCELACACDWIYASSRARFGQPEVNLGLIPGFGGTSRLVRRVGLSWAKELVLTGENIEADQAMAIGLVNRVFEPDELMAKAIEAGETIASRGPLAVAAAKRLMQESQDADVRIAHALEQGAFGVTFATEDRSEGMQAYLEKRDPKFQGK